MSMAEEQEIGEVKDFFARVNVAAIELSDDLKVGDKIHFKGHTTDFVQKVDSMQIDRNDVREAS